MDEGAAYATKNEVALASLLLVHASSELDYKSEMGHWANTIIAHTSRNTDVGVVVQYSRDALLSWTTRTESC